MTTTSDYRETPYEDATFELVGDAPGPEEFLPMQIVTLERSQKMTDEMFFDFGGNRAEAERLWHLPKDVEYRSEDKKKLEEERMQQRELEIQARIDAAREEGFQQGAEQAKAQMEADMKEQLATIEQNVTAVMRDYKAQIDEKVVEIEKAAVRLAAELAEKIIPHAVEINPEYLLPIVQEALQLSGGAIIKEVRVSPEDLEFISVMGLADSIKQFDGSWSFVADESIRAGCIVNTSAGVVEYDLEKAWQRTKEQIITVLK